MTIRSIFIPLIIISSLQLEAFESSAQRGSSAIINCFIGNAQPGDTLHLQVWNDNLSERSSRDIPVRNFMSLNNKGSFRFVVDSLRQPVYFTLSKDRNSLSAGYLPFMWQYLLEPDDDLLIEIDSMLPKYTHIMIQKDEVLDGYRFVNPRFSGKGAAKTEFMFSVDSLTSHWLQTTYKWKQQPRTSPPVLQVDSAYYSTMPGVMEGIYEDNRAILDYQLNQLEGYKTRMSGLAFQILRTNLVGRMEEADVRRYIDHRPSSEQNGISASFSKSLEQQLRKIYENRKKPAIAGTPPTVLALSKDYIDFLTDYAFYMTPDRYFYLKANYEGVFRDKLLTDFLLKWFFYLKDSQQALQDAESTVQDAFCFERVNNLYGTQSVGSTAYVFSLPDTKGNIRKLSDFEGKIVFIDLWFTGCMACNSFYHYQLSRVEDYFNNNPDVVFVTISIDTDKVMWLKSVQSGSYSAPDKENVVNLYTQGRGNEDPLIKAYNVTGYPHPFMIDRNGKIYRVNNLQALAENLIPIINEAIAKK